VSEFSVAAPFCCRRPVQLDDERARIGLRGPNFADAWLRQGDSSDPRAPAKCSSKRENHEKCDVQHRASMIDQVHELVTTLGHRPLMQACSKKESSCDRRSARDLKALTNHHICHRDRSKCTPRLSGAILINRRQPRCDDCTITSSRLLGTTRSCVDCRTLPNLSTRQALAAPLTMSRSAPI
jgi:hypothetical protein